MPRRHYAITRAYRHTPTTTNMKGYLFFKHYHLCVIILRCDYAVTRADVYHFIHYDNTKMKKHAKIVMPR